MIIHQPHQGNLGDQLISALNSGNYTRLAIMCAYAKTSGVSRIYQTLTEFKNAGGAITLFIGIDQKNTTHDALKALFDLADQLYVVHNENLSHTFHHKVYMLDNLPIDSNGPNYPSQLWIATGSNNLTLGGLYINYESFTISEPDMQQQYGQNMYSGTVSIINHYQNQQGSISMLINTENQIDDLLNNGYITTESQSRVATASEARRNNANTNTFGSEIFVAPAPQVTFPQTRATPTIAPPTTITPSVPLVMPQPVVGLPAGTVNEIFWFEMRASTGGSRNILDLSSRGRLRAGTPGNYAINGNDVRGSVEFFGITPTSHNITREITINYNGHNYYPSTVLFAPNNGSWRLQLKGESTTAPDALSTYGITDFVGNILIFEKLSIDHYFLTVVPANQLQALQNQSIFYATNGASLTSKQYGRLQ